MRYLFTLVVTLLLAQPVFAAADQRGLVVRPKAPTGEEARGDLWLLTIGINSYLFWPRLRTAVNDAKSLKEVLLKRYYLDPSHVVELTDDKATRHNILGAFRDLAKKVKPEDSLLVYYAGHGHIDGITGKGSWIPVESGTDDPTAWISNRDVTDYLNVNAIKARHVLMVSDSCFSGDFFRGSRGALPTIDDAFLKKAYTRSSRQAISSGGLEPVSDAGFGGNSVFSHFLVAALDNNSKPYFIPSELFGEIRAGVGRNADQLPQFGDLHGTGGQEGGELILFLKDAAESRLHDMGAASVARQKELELLRKAEAEAAVAKQKEQQEIARKQAELDALDRQIAEMKGRLGSGVARSGDSMDQLLAMAEQKEQQGQHLDELRRQREDEEQKRQQEIERLKAETVEKRRGQIEADLAKFKKIAASKYAQDMKPVAWNTLVASYPEAKDVPQYDEKGFRKALGLDPKGFTAAITDAQFIYKYANNLPATHPMNIRAAEMAKNIKKETGGRVAIQIFPSNQLGSDTDMLSQIRSGAIQFFTLSPGILSTLVPNAFINGVGFAFKDYNQVWAAMDGDLGLYVRNEIAKTGTLFAFEKIWDNGFRLTTTSSRPIKTPEDYKGLKIRVPVSPLWTSMFKAFGSAPASINFSEVYSSLQTKTVEAQENPLAIISTAKLYEVQKYCSKTNHMWDGFWFLGNKKAWDKLPKDLQEIVAKNINAAGEKQRADVRKLNDMLEKELQAKGLVFNNVDTEAFRVALRKAGFYDEWHKKFGDDAWKLLEKYTGRLR